MGSLDHKLGIINSFLNIPRFPRYSMRRNFKSAALDFVVALLAYSVAFWGRAVTSTIDYFQSLPFIFFSAAVILISLYIFGIYQRIWERTSGHGAAIIVNAVGFATLIIVPVDILLQNRPLPLSVIAIGNVLALGGFITLRYRSRLLSGASWRWKAIWNEEVPVPVTQVLIVGAGESGQALAWRLKHRSPRVRYAVVGFVDDDAEKQGMYIENSPILGTRSDIPTLTKKHKIDLIIVAIHNISGPDFREILSYCESTDVRINVVPDVFALMNAKRNVSMLRDVQPEDLIGRSTVTRHEAVNLQAVTGKVVLVTGAAGSIGSELSRQLIDYAPVKLILLDCNESGLYDLCTEIQSKTTSNTFVPALVDITDRTALERIFSTYRPQIVFHAAAYKHVPVLEQYPEQAVRVNIGGTRNLAELAYENAVERFVLISTDKAVNPSSVMGASKRVCEILLDSFTRREDHNTLFASVRFGNVLGSRGSVVPTFNHQIDSGGPVTITHKEMTRYFMSIPEAVNLVIHAACLTNGGDIFLLKMGEVVRIIDLAERMIRLRGLRPYEDIEIKFTGVRPGEKLHEELYTSSENVIETAHPNIIRLDHPTIDWDTQELLNAIDDLKHEIDRSNALEMLQSIINHAQSDQIVIEPTSVIS
jgi:FlaA1/EpsC-like NDP-sugar epimerase